MDEENGSNEMVIDRLGQAASSLGAIMRKVDTIVEKPSRDRIEDI